ncbi:MULTISPECIES: type VI secretion system baseplate subunit TssE [Silvimonas]|uniref:type VI secretion system baseplate subunit TssE n=1 Tax=Silvimonas TaxID=300264 RepID=UPI0024B33AF8|nr:MULTISPECIES: type VI secretion system baseplate subunit TssE [Silvimonas]MDR3428727.1 type VI secretion system baseplate subunit TssE [Silvimonas sp.]
MTGPALYELLTGHFADGTAIDAFDEKTQTIISVMDSMQRILNSRAGSLSHLPDYGLPDLTTIYRELPASAHKLKRTIEATLIKYEPRLRSIEIELQPMDEEAILSYTLVCHLRRAGLVRFGTWFSPEGQVRLSRYR